MKSAKQAVAYLRRFRTINYGGCLVAAYTFYVNEKRAGRADNLQIVALGHYKDGDIEKNEKFIKGKRQKPTSGAHFGWTYDGGETVFDVNGEDTTYSYKLLIPKDITEAFAVSSLNTNSWNRSFNRARIVPKIAKYFDIDFSNVRQPETSSWW